MFLDWVKTKPKYFLVGMSILILTLVIWEWFLLSIISPFLEGIQPKLFSNQDRIEIESQFSHYREALQGKNIEPAYKMMSPVYRRHHSTSEFSQDASYYLDLIGHLQNEIWIDGWGDSAKISATKDQCAGTFISMTRDDGIWYVDLVWFDTGDSFNIFSCP